MVDTNVVIDALTGREPFHEVAEAIFLQAAARTFEAYLTANSITDIYYLTRKHLHDPDLTKDVIGKLLSLFMIQDVKYEDCFNAVVSDMSDFEDAVLANCASRAGADYIVTRNTKDFKQSSIAAITPHEFLDILSQEDLL